MPLTFDTVMGTILAEYPESPIVSTCGYTSRALFNLEDRPGNFYLVGAMGAAASIAIGIDIATSVGPVVAVDGDGSALMNLSVFPLVGSVGRNIIHVVLDNESHESTGGQRTVGTVDFAAIARACGYRSIALIDTEEDLATLHGLRRYPAFVHCKISKRTQQIGPRISLAPQQLVARTCAYVTSTQC